MPLQFLTAGPTGDIANLYGSLLTDMPSSSHPPTTETARAAAGTVRETQPAADDRICWIEVNRYPYQPDLQVELLHLQAEADALLLQLQAASQKRLITAAAEA